MQRGKRGKVDEPGKCEVLLRLSSRSVDATGVGGEARFASGVVVESAV